MLGEISDRVAHGVGILAYKQPLAWGGREVGLDLIHRRVVDVEPVAHRGVGVVVDRTRAVDALDRVAHRSEVGARSALVPKRPDDDARVVLVTLRHCDGSIDVSEPPRGIVPENPIARAECVAFLVRLVHDVDAVLVAEPVPVRVVRVVAGADEIDVGPLHQDDVTFHRLPIHKSTRSWDGARGG